VEKIVIEQKQSKAIMFLFLDILLFITSIAAWILGKKDKLGLLWATGLLGIIIFGIAFFIFMGRATEHKPLLTITFDGIIDSSSVTSVGYIPFQDIENFIIVNIMNQRVIGVIPKNEDSFIEKLSPIKQEIARQNLQQKYPPLAISVNKAKDMSLEDIFTLLKKRLDDYSCLYD
jgi:hypothetical protein